jgi:hypothetical protein
MEQRAQRTWTLRISILPLERRLAYYWLWSRHPDICYLDKGPVIAWFILLDTKLFGQTVFGIRFFAVILATGTGIALSCWPESFFRIALPS